MPLYEYRCEDCQRESELLIRGEERPVCPHCQSARLEKLLSVPAAPAVSGNALPVCAPPMTGGCGRPQCGMGGCQFDD